MSYLALYRRYRPQTFSQVLGQPIITQTLRNQIKSGKFTHAYLFCGSRGTGKTSTAKILARALNCLSPVDGDPCGQCEICKMSDGALSSDIIEIDAASNNGVDEIRDLRDKIRYGPALTKYKVYIIDEVHMLSSGAFNALLKTLEEPPAHAVFILATTEFYRLPATIVSRCQRFDFLQFSDETIVDHLKTVLAELEKTAEPDALFQIARAAEGGMRDALSLLDQCLMVSEHLTLMDVYRVTGLIGGQSVDRMILAFDAQNIAQMLKTIDEAAKSGANLEVFVRECMQQLRDRLISADSSHQARYAFAIEVLAQTQTQMRYSPRQRVLLDAAAVRLCMPQGENSQLALMARVEALEAKLAQQALTLQGAASAEQPKDPKLEMPKKEEQKPNAAAPPSWEEEDAPPPWDMEPEAIVQAREPKQSNRRGQISEPVQPAKAVSAPMEDAKAVFLAEMGKVSAGVSQSIRLCQRVVRIRETAYIVFGARDSVFVDALRQHQQDLNRIAEKLYGEGVTAKAITEDKVPPMPLDEQTVAQKAQAIFGVPVEIENS